MNRELAVYVVSGQPLSPLVWSIVGGVLVVWIGLLFAWFARRRR